MDRFLKKYNKELDLYVEVCRYDPYVNNILLLTTKNFEFHRKFFQNIKLWPLKLALIERRVTEYQSNLQ